MFTTRAQTHALRIFVNAELLSRQDVHNMLEDVEKTDSAVVDELIPDRLTIGVVHRVLRSLLSEQVSLHDLAAVLETLSDYAADINDPVLLAEFCRRAIKGHIVGQHQAEDGTLYAPTGLVHEPQQSVERKAERGNLNLPPPGFSDHIVDSAEGNYEHVKQECEGDVIVLSSPLVRLQLVRLLHRQVADLPVLSHTEVSNDVPLEIVGGIQLPVPELAGNPAGLYVGTQVSLSSLCAHESVKK